MDNFNGSEAAFAIGNVVEIGLRYGIKPKEWYGPSTVIQILDELNEKHAPFANLKTAAFPEGIVYKEEIISRACGAPTVSSIEKAWKNSVIVMVGIRLGLDMIPAEMQSGIFRIFDMQHCIGMVGGQGKGALYFVGYQDKDLIFLDPHVAQTAVEKQVDLWAEHQTYHYSVPLKLAVGKLDTCVVFGFYLASFKDYEIFVDQIAKEQAVKDSFVQISDHKPVYEEKDIEDV